MYMQFTEVLELKKEIDSRFKLYLHFHDGCGGQFFSFDQDINEDVKSFISDYFADKNARVKFSEDGKNFTLE